MRARWTWMVLGLILGCAGDKGTSKPGGGTPTGSPVTGTGGGAVITGTGDLDLACAVQNDNPLRFDCTATTKQATSLELSWQPTGGGTERSMSVPDSLLQHSFTVWGMKAETEYQLTVTGMNGSAQGALTTGTLPADLDREIAVATGTSSVDQILFELPCGDLPTVAMLDTDGDIVWYQQYPDPGWQGIGIPFQGYQYTPRGTVLMSLGMNKIYEHTLAGTLVREWTRGVDWPDVPIHHDIHMGTDGRIYTLYGEVVTPNAATYLMDGVLVMDDQGVIGDWHMADVWPVTDGWGAGAGVFWEHEFPGVSEYSHANSIAVNDDRQLTISIKSQETVFQIDGDPASPTFGELEWILAGDPANHPEDGDFTITSTGGITAGLDFHAQHHASFFGDNRIGLFDNRSGVGTSRGLVMDLDLKGGTADIVEVFEAGEDCPAQGSLYPMPNGNRLLTCGPSQTTREFAPGAKAPHFTIDVSCGGSSPMVPRGIPVQP